MADKKKKAGMKDMSSYFREVSAELKKVVYPTMVQVRTNTIIVLIMVFIVGVFIWTLDWGFSRTVAAVINLGGESEFEGTSPYDNMTEEDIMNWLNSLPQDESENVPPEEMPEGTDLFDNEDGASNTDEQLPAQNESVDETNGSITTENPDENP